MVLRGILARRLVSLALLLLMCLVVAGTVATVGFAERTEVSGASVGMLVLLGLVAMSAQSMESMRRREREVALARLRGRRGLRLVVFAVAEPALVVLLGAAAGLGAGWLLGKWAVGAWLQAGASYRLDGAVLEAAGAVTAGALGVVVVSCWRVVRSPLLGQLGATRRPRAASTAALFVQLVLMVGAVVAVYQARQAASARVDWVTLVSPAVVGLAAGQAVTWLLLGVLSLLVVRRPAAGLGWFLTWRRLLRRADSAALLRTVVAAGVVAGVAVSALTLAQGWRDERARLQVGAPVSYHVPAGALRAYAAAHAADPEGRWLMPVAYVVDGEVGGDRRVLVDTPRWGRVVGDFLSSTHSADVDAASASLRTTRTVHYTTARRLGAVVDTSAIGPRQRLVVVVQYVDDAGELQVAPLTLTSQGGVPVAGGSLFSAAVGDCTAACSVAQVTVEGRSLRPLRLQSLTFGRLQLLAPSSGAQLAPSPSTLDVRRAGAGIVVGREAAAGADRAVLATFRSPAPQPVLRVGATAIATADGVRVVAGIDGVPHRARVQGTVRALPFAGTQGVVADLASMLAGSGGGVVAADAAVLARADTPADVIAALRATHAIGRQTTYADVSARLDEAPRAQGTRLYALIAALAALVAVISIVSTGLQQNAERRVEAASLRSVGVTSSVLSAAYRREVLVLASAAVIGTAIAVWVSCWALLGALPLVSGWAFAPRLDLTPDPAVVAGTALGAAVVVAGITHATLRRVGRTAPPRLLREDAA